MSMLEIEQVAKRYGRVQALRPLALAVPTGSRTAIVGPSGSGKTTLLRLIAGFEPPDQGRIRLDGRLLADGAMVVPAHRRGIGFVPQDGALFPHLSVRENIGFGLDRRLPDRQARVERLMAMVELDRSMATRAPHELSGGQQQRVALARALAREPRLMLLDEPFSALDTGLRESLRQAVVRLLEHVGITAILVTHDQAEALSFASQLAVLREGRLVQAGPPQELYRRPVDEATALFLGDALLLEALIGDGFADCRLGRLAIAPGRPPGPARVMLRPEQLRLAAAAAAGESHGLVRRVTFAGTLSTVEVALDEGTPPLPIRTPSIALPTPGDRVRITVEGPAHVLARR